VITCPVCEQPQADQAECLVCGHALGVGAAGAAGAEPAVAPLEGLETNAQETGAAVDLGGTFPELEPTLLAVAGAVAADPMPELEATLAAPVEAPGELVPDLEPTSAAPSADGRTELPLFPVCRYCRTPAGPGEKLCGRCGMQLGGLVPPGPVAAGTGPRLCSCGTPITRATCPACGARNRTE
jgi:hypothetical protein